MPMIDIEPVSLLAFVGAELFKTRIREMAARCDTRRKFNRAMRATCRSACSARCLRPRKQPSGITAGFCRDSQSKIPLGMRQYFLRSRAGNKPPANAEVQRPALDDDNVPVLTWLIGRNTLSHIKFMLSGVYEYAISTGVIPMGANPVRSAV
jgi:hypothetical protein